MTTHAATVRTRAPSTPTTTAIIVGRLSFLSPSGVDSSNGVLDPEVDDVDTESAADEIKDAESTVENEA